MNLPLVSILVPIYGVEKYIERCAESLFSQSYENIEYVFVNDCTKDRSIEILENVITRYPHRKRQIKIISHDRNRGLAAARNTGVENAHGEYILCVDSDDYVDMRVVEKLVCKQQENDADIVCCDVYECHQESLKLQRNCYAAKPEVFIKKIFLGKQKHWIWGKLIRKALYEKNSIRAVEGCNMAEDFQVLPRLAYYAKRIDYVKEPLCFYECSNSSSYCKTINENLQRQKWQSYDFVYSFFKTTKLCTYIEYSAADMVYSHLKTCFFSEGLNEDYFNMLKARWRKLSFFAKARLPLKRRVFSEICFVMGYFNVKKVIPFFNREMK